MVQDNLKSNRLLIKKINSVSIVFFHLHSLISHYYLFIIYFRIMISLQIEQLK